MQSFLQPHDGVCLLDQHTNYSWCPIHPLQLLPNVCTTTIIPNNPSLASRFPILSQYHYTPRGVPFTNQVERFYQYLKNKHHDYLQAIPAIKYELNDIELKPKPLTFATPRGTMIVEGAAGIEGELVVKPKNMNPNLIISANDIRHFSMQANTAKDNFITSFKIESFNPDKHTLTIGSSLSNSFTLTSTNIKLTIENANTIEIQASYTPDGAVQEINMNGYPFTLEIHMSYNFSGKATIYPNTNVAPAQSTHHWARDALLILGGGAIIIGSVILALPSGGSSLLGGGALIGGVVTLGAS